LPARIHLLPFPAYSPELNPPERLWDVIKDQLCNRLYQGIAAMCGFRSKVTTDFGNK
jgi:hypothetical protein